MRVKPTSPLFEPFVRDAIVTPRHPRSCFGRPVLVLLGEDGGAVGPLEAEFARFEVLDATEEERQRLHEGGYRLKGINASASPLARQ